MVFYSIWNAGINSDLKIVRCYRMANCDFIILIYIHGLFYLYFILCSLFMRDKNNINNKNNNHDFGTISFLFHFIFYTHTHTHTFSLFSLSLSIITLPTSHRLIHANSDFFLDFFHFLCLYHIAIR